MMMSQADCYVCGLEEDIIARDFCCGKFLGKASQYENITRDVISVSGLETCTVYCDPTFPDWKNSFDRNMVWKYGITEHDINLVMSQAGVKSKGQALSTLIKWKGDVVNSIMELI